MGTDGGAEAQYNRRRSFGQGKRVNLLAFDSSMTGCAAAVLTSGTGGTWQVCARAEAPLGKGQSETLMPLLETVMAKARLGWGDLDLIAVTVGPGSFTGLRIGLAAARGLALSLNVKVAGIATPEAIAAGVPADERQGRPILVAIDSKRADHFIQAFAPDLMPLTPVAAMTPEAAIALAGPSPILAGDGAQKLAALIPGAAISSTAPLPDPVVFGPLAAQHFAAGTALAAEPLYLRPADVTMPNTPR